MKKSIEYSQNIIFNLLSRKRLNIPSCMISFVKNGFKKEKDIGCDDWWNMEWSLFFYGVKTSGGILLKEWKLVKVR